MILDKYSKKFIHYYIEEIPAGIEDEFSRISAKNMMDLGSGDGAILFALFKRGYLKGLDKVIAVDISSSRLSNVKKIDNKFLCVASDACKLALSDNAAIDFIIANQVIEHVADEDVFIKEIHRVLSTNGVVYLSTVFKKKYGWYFYRCNGKWVLDPTHVREYTQAEPLLSLLKKNNFEILKDTKQLFWFPVMDFIIKRINPNRAVYKNSVFKSLRKIKIPIIGYYNWQLILRKTN